MDYIQREDEQSWSSTSTAPPCQHVFSITVISPCFFPNMQSFQLFWRFMLRLAQKINVSSYRDVQVVRISVWHCNWHCTSHGGANYGRSAQSVYVRHREVACAKGAHDLTAHWFNRIMTHDIAGDAEAIYLITEAAAVMPHVCHT